MMIEAMLSKWTLFLLVLVRVIGMFSIAPFWSGEGAPMLVKTALACATSLAIFPGVMAKDLIAHEFSTPYQFAGAIIEQSAIGMVIGFLASMFFVIFENSARFYDTQMGLGVINVLDPFHATEGSVMGQFQTFIALLVFIGVDGPQQLLFALHKSFFWVPHLNLSSGALPRAVFTLFSKIFYIALIFVLPMLGVLFITHVIMGVLSRASPQLNVMILGFPINFAIGIFTFILALDYYQNIIPEIFLRMFEEIDLVMMHVMR